MFSRKTLAAVLIGTALAGLCAREALAERSLLVIPAREAVLQFAVDVTRVRPADLIMYDTRGEKGNLVLYFWDAGKRDWTLTSLEEFRARALFDELPARVFLVGADRDMPADVLAAATSIGGKLIRVTSLRVADMANAMGEPMRFSAGDWKWLAKRHGLQTVDLNANKRTHGRYGSFGSQPTPPAMPPAAVQESTIEQMTPAPLATPTPAPVAESPNPAPSRPVEKLPEDK